jgi:N-acetylmuramoyl-L-alanine amidase
MAFGGALLCSFAACRTPPSPPPEPLATIAIEDSLPIVPPAPLADLTKETGEPPRPAPAPAPPIAPPDRLEGWVSIQSWLERHAPGRAAVVASNPHLKYQIQTPQGTFRLSPGTRVAFWNHVGIWLGYAPRMVKGLLHVHSLDAQGCLLPLLSLPRLPRAPGRMLVLDPGHGGMDSGARNVADGGFEKAYTLDWAQRLARLLARQGWRVVLTRTNDAEVSLAQRVQIAERAEADLFLSLHFNSGDRNASLQGVETFCLTPTGLPSSLVRGAADDLRRVYANNAFDEENLRYAVALHDALLRHTGALDRGVRRARFMGVLRGQRRPAVLIEAGYLSNPEEARRIATPAYRQKLAEAVAAALE